MFIATIGFYQQSRLEFALMERSVERIELIHSSAEKSKEGAMGIKNKYPHRVNLHEADAWNYLELLNLALSIVNENPDYIPEFHIGLGTRVMTMALAMAAIFTDSKMFLVIEEEREPKDLIEIPLLPLTTLSAQKKFIMRVLRGMEDTEAESQRALQKAMAQARRERGLTPEEEEPPSMSSISRHLRDLDRWDFVERVRRGRHKAVRLTNLGQTVLAMKETRETIWKD